MDWNFLLSSPLFLLILLLLLRLLLFNVRCALIELDKSVEPVLFFSSSLPIFLVLRISSVALDKGLCIRRRKNARWSSTWLNEIWFEHCFTTWSLYSVAFSKHFLSFIVAWFYYGSNWKIKIEFIWKVYKNLFHLGFH